jgi:hypothetical protein
LTHLGRTVILASSKKSGHPVKGGKAHDAKQI